MAVRIASGEDGLIENLWDQVRPFIAKQAQIRLRSFPSQAVDEEDLIQAGFLGLLEAVRTFTADMECSFVTWLSYSLKNAFSEALGVRSVKQQNDPIHRALSLDVPLSADDSEGGTLADIVPDKRDQYEDADQKIWLEQLREALDAAIDDLPEDQREAVRLKYYDARPILQAAADMGVKPGLLQSRASRGVHSILKSKHKRELEQFMYEVDRKITEQTDVFFGMSLKRFRITHSSGVELLAIQRDQMRQNILREHLGMYE